MWTGKTKPFSPGPKPKNRSSEWQPDFVRANPWNFAPVFFHGGSLLLNLLAKKLSHFERKVKTRRNAAWYFSCCRMGTAVEFSNKRFPIWNRSDPIPFWNQCIPSGFWNQSETELDRFDGTGAVSWCRLFSRETTANLWGLSSFFYEGCGCFNRKSSA